MAAPNICSARISPSVAADARRTLTRLARSLAGILRTIAAVSSRRPNNQQPVDHLVGGGAVVAALFVMIGATPHTGWLPDSIGDRHEFVLTGGDVPGFGSPGDTGPAPLPLETSLPGVFAAGDVRAGSVKRVASAAGEGSVAIPEVHQHLQRQATQPAPHR